MIEKKVSIIIPIYNVDKYLRDGLDSVIEQTYNQIEIVCVNDGSSDSCPVILQEYVEKDNRIKVLNQKNSGTLVARKAGVAVATGDYIMFVDPDDKLYSTAVEDAVRKIEKENCDIVVFGCKFCGEKIKKSEEKAYLDRHFNKCLEKFSVLNSRTEILTECFINHNIPYHQWGKIYRADIVKNAFEIIPDIRCVFAEDQGTALILFNHSDKVAFLNKKLYCYRVGMGISTLSQYSIKRYIECLQSFDMLSKVQTYVAEQNENKKLLEKISKDIETTVVKTAVMLVDRLQDGVCTDEWLEPLLQKCHNTPLLVKELMNKGTVAHETIWNYESRLNQLSRKNKKHLKQLRIVIVIAVLLLMAVIGLLLSRYI